MLAFGTRAHATTRRRSASGADVTVMKSEWMESGTDTELSPTVFLIEQAPNSTAAAHFHRQNQFQLFVGGSGTIGRTRIEPITIHYAGAYTGYGPLAAGPEGLSYFTMRPAFESGALTIKEKRDEMRSGPKRHATTHLAPATSSTLHNLGALESLDLMPPSEDGLGAQEFLMPPGVAVAVPVHAGTDGTFAMVLAGSAACGDRELSVWEHLFVTSVAEATIKAGPDGAQLLCLFTPSKASVYRSA